MDIVYSLQGVKFEWNFNKAQINLEKHGVTFEEAAEVFFDPFYQIGDATANNEGREFILGYSLSYRLLLVVFLEKTIPAILINFLIKMAPLVQKWEKSLQKQPIGKKRHFGPENPLFGVFLHLKK